MTFADHLLAWYDRHRRALPWRLNRDPYRVLVSEIMLQQTQIDTVLKYYEPFLKRFPDFETLAAAPEDDVLTAWKGLGYYRRAKHLHMAAKQIVQHHGGEMPSTYAGLKKLPGIGAYTAAAVASICFGQPHAVVDGNVLRVAARLFRLDQPLDSSALKTDVQRRIDAWISRTRPGDFNQAMMELGQSTCTVTSPRCESCPVQPWCAAYEAGDVDQFPIPGRKIEQKLERRRVFVIACGNVVLMRQRPENGLLARMWEFPGVLSHDQEKEEPFLISFQQIGLSIDAGRDAVFRRVGRVNHRFTHLIWDMDVVAVQLGEQGGVPSVESPWQWVPRDQVTKIALPTAMAKVWRVAQADG